jgi:hypothetical protein
MGKIVRMLIEQTAGSCKRYAVFCVGAWTAIVSNRQRHYRGSLPVFTARTTLHATDRTAGFNQPQGERTKRKPTYHLFDCSCRLSHVVPTGILICKITQSKPCSSSKIHSVINKLRPLSLEIHSGRLGHRRRTAKKRSSSITRMCVLAFLALGLRHCLFTRSS